MALYIHGPLRCKDLLGRIPNPHSRPALAAPQHRQQNAQHYPHTYDQTARRQPGHTQHTPTQPRSDTQPPTLEAVQHPQPHTIRPPDSTKARPTIKPDRLFLLHDGAGRRPHCPLHPYSAGEISHRSGKERTTSTTTAPHPTRAGPHWKPTADPAGSSNHHAHDQTAYAPAARPVHAAPVLVMGTPPADTAQHTASRTQTARKFRSLNRPAHTAGHQKQGTA